MAAKKLKLAVGFYDQPQLDKDGNFDPQKGSTTRRTQGEVFEAKSDQEYDRLLEIGAAVDPDKANAQEAEKLRARLQELESERQATEVKLAATETVAEPLNVDDLKGKELNDALESRGLSLVDGEGKKLSAEDKRSALADRLSANPENPAAHTGA